MLSENIAFPLLKYLLAITFKTSIVYITASLLSLALRKHSSVLKRALWAVVILSFVCLLIQPFFPSIWEISLDSFRTPKEISTSLPDISKESAPQIESMSPPNSGLPYLFNSLRSWSDVFILFWIIGMLIYGFHWLKGRWLFKKIKRDSFAPSQKLNGILKASAKQIGISRPIKIKTCRHLYTACTWGIKNPEVLFPAESEDWPDSSIRMVIFHELAHIKRKDSLLETVIQGLCILFWFHPVIWMTVNKYRNEREKACDETVIKNGIKPSEYASYLLKLASSIKNRKISLMKTAALSNRAGIRSRLLAILNPTIKKINQRMNCVVILSLCAIFISLSLVSLHSGILGEPLGRDALIYWSTVPDRKTSAAFMFEKDIYTRGFSAALYNLKQRDSSGSNQYHFSRKEIDTVGRRLLEAGNIKEALDTFQMNAKMFPNTWQVYNSLGNAFQAKGDLKKAIDYYEKMLGLDVPSESKIRRYIAELKENIQ